MDMSELRNRVGQLAVIVPFEGAAPDIQAHGGKIVTPVSYGPCGLGGDAWNTEPTHLDAYGNAISWNDQDLKPLGGADCVEQITETLSA